MPKEFYYSSRLLFSSCLPGSVLSLCASRPSLSPPSSAVQGAERKWGSALDGISLPDRGARMCTETRCHSEETRKVARAQTGVTLGLAEV